MKERVRKPVKPEFQEPEWITAEEYEKKVAEAKAWSVEAHADRELYSNEDYWYAPTEQERNYSGERG